jgi:hypothetical protein
MQSNDYKRAWLCKHSHSHRRWQQRHEVQNHSGGTTWQGKQSALLARQPLEPLRCRSGAGDSIQTHMLGTWPRIRNCPHHLCVEDHYAQYRAGVAVALATLAATQRGRHRHAKSFALVLLKAAVDRAGVQQSCCSFMHWGLFNGVVAGECNVVGWPHPKLTCLVEFCCGAWYCCLWVQGAECASPLLAAGGPGCALPAALLLPAGLAAVCGSPSASKHYDLCRKVCCDL